MTTVIVDEEGEPWVPIPGWVRPSKAELLAKGFGPEVEFRPYEGKPYAVWPDSDFAECWGPGPISNAHPFAPYLRDTKIPESEFRALVALMDSSITNSPADTSSSR
jgi:hypothetical protein